MRRPRVKKVYSWKEAFADAYAAAKAGSARSQTFVGYCYYLGRVVPKDLKAARRWNSKAARQGYLAAIYNLAAMKDNGFGGRRDPSAALRLYREAAVRGDLQCQTNLAAMLLDGDASGRIFPREFAG